MALLDDTAIFVAVIQQGGFSHAAKHLGLSNGLVSRRIAQLETALGVSLIKRTTRQFHLTPEGELLWNHAKRIQQELDTAVSLIQTSLKKPKGTIRISAPVYFGRHYLTPLIMDFLNDFEDIKIDLILSNQRLDVIKDQLDLVIRGKGFLENITSLKDSSLKMKILYKEEIGLYASHSYLLEKGMPHSPEDLNNHLIINYADSKSISNVDTWGYIYKNKKNNVILKPKFNSNDIESNLTACQAGFGIGRFTQLNVRHALQYKKLQLILQEYNWGYYNLYALYPTQQALPKRVRLLLDFIESHMKNM